MQNFLEHLKDTFRTTGTVHHAYFLIGSSDEAIPHLYSFLENTMGIKTHGNPDVWHGHFDTLTIDDARKISLSQEAKDFSGNKKIFIIQTNTIGEQAQNSLLKVFEEPTLGTHFFILMPQDTLLPTLRSRVYTIHTISNRTSSQSVLNMNFTDRMQVVKDITTGISDEVKTKQDAILLLNKIEDELHSKGVEKFSQALMVCQNAREALYDNGAPVKMILENVMLSI